MIPFSALIIAFIPVLILGVIAQAVRTGAAGKALGRTRKPATPAASSTAFADDLLDPETGL